MTTQPKFSIGQLVNRIENRESTLATVLQQIYYEHEDEYVYYVSYIEGGAGYWPESCLAEVPNL
jgi:hypothetical protein